MNALLNTVSNPDSLSTSQFIWWLIGAIVTMAGAVGFLHRDAMGRMDRDKKELKDDFEKHKNETKQTITDLNTKLFDSLKGEQDARLNAAKYEIMARTPCPIPECPRRSTSFSIGEAKEKII